MLHLWIAMALTMGAAVAVGLDRRAASRTRPSDRAFVPSAAWRVGRYVLVGLLLLLSLVGVPAVVTLFRPKPLRRDVRIELLARRQQAGEPS